MKQYLNLVSFNDGKTNFKEYFIDLPHLVIKQQTSYIISYLITSSNSL